MFGGRRPVREDLTQRPITPVDLPCCVGVGDRGADFDPIVRIGCALDHAGTQGRQRDRWNGGRRDLNRLRCGGVKMKPGEREIHLPASPDRAATASDDDRTVR